VRSIFERSDDMPKLVYHGETIRLRPEDGPRLIERFTGRTFEVRHDAAGAYLAAADVLGTFPVAVLLPA
jgi:hypothetical protein